MVVWPARRWMARTASSRTCSRAVSHRGWTAARRAARGRGRGPGRATATRCCWPPESWPRCDRRGHQADQRNVLIDALFLIGLGPAAHPQAEGNVLGHGHVRKERVVLELQPRHCACWPAAGRRGGSRSGSRRHPVASARRSCARSSMLPQPDGPSSVTNSPGATSRRQVADRGEGAELLAHAVEVDRLRGRLERVGRGHGISPFAT